ncbi:MAG TPA: tetratricopeptide repeat protein [Gemmatimonadales bacterium]
MTDEIRTLTQRLADEPSSLAFLELGETLRRRGQLDAACKVTRAGLTRYPGLADAHDLLGRILSDLGDLAGAFDAWADALRFDPMRTGALKGIAFLYFRAGDVAAALDHLQRAAEADPDDPAIPQAIARVRRDAGRAGLPAVEEPAGPDRHREAPAPATEAAVAEADVAESDVVQAIPAAPPAPAEADRAIPHDSPFAGIAEDERGLLLADASGQRLGGEVGRHGMESGDRVAAQLAGLSREAARATRLLGLGGWHSIAVETADAHLFLSAPTAETVLLAVREPSVPMARLGLLAERAGRAARHWLEQIR